MPPLGATSGAMWAPPPVAVAWASVCVRTSRPRGLEWNLPYNSNGDEAKLAEILSMRIPRRVFHSGQWLDVRKRKRGNPGRRKNEGREGSTYLEALGPRVGWLPVGSSSRGFCSPKAPCCGASATPSRRARNERQGEYSHTIAIESGGTARRSTSPNSCT